MRIEGIEGEVFSRALYRSDSDSPWDLSSGYFGSKAEAQKYLAELYPSAEVKWPIDIVEGGAVIVEDL